ncbi:MAG: hypothetical protein A2017_15505 [Lentisphaerae bacterium GWF2_44_16]|nr:MAG: hypothetical protein A2017_15505 [Lentisphaerae bacterium GWF2_44_16]
MNINRLLIFKTAFHRFYEAFKFASASIKEYNIVYVNINKTGELRMKKLIVLLAALSLIAGVYAGGDKAKEKSSCKNETKATEYKKYAADYEAKAKDAETKGNAALAAAYKKCAAAKAKIASAYANGDSKLLGEANKEYSAASGELKSLTGCDKKDKKSSCSKTEGKTSKPAK